LIADDQALALLDDRARALIGEPEVERRLPDIETDLSQVALNAEIAFVTQPSLQTELAYRQAHGGFTSAQVEFHEAQYARIMHASGAGQLAKFLAEQLDAKLQLLEEVSVENRDAIKHFSGLITTLIERLESPITGRRRLEGETE